MSQQNNHQLVEIIDPDVDPEQIMVDIRNRMRAERKKRKYDAQTFPEFGQSAMLDQLEELNIDSDLYRSLQQAHQSATLIDSSALIVDSPATRVPILGRIWRMIRGNAHQLVLFYIKRSAQQQVMANKDMLDVLNRLTIMLYEQQETIDELRTELGK